MSNMFYLQLVMKFILMTTRSLQISGRYIALKLLNETVLKTEATTLENIRLSDTQFPSN